MNVTKSILDIDPAALAAGASLLWAIVQQFRKRRYKKALGAVLEGAEVATENPAVTPRQAIAAEALRQGVEQIVNDVLDERRVRILAERRKAQK